MVFIALFALVFWGTGAEGQMPFAEGRKMVLETAVSFIPRQNADRDLAYINGVYAGTGGDSSGVRTPIPTMDAATINQSALLSLAPPDGNYIDQITTQRSDVIEYTVQDGDLLSFIAGDYGVSQNSIIWLNGLKNADSISPGQVLRIPPITGVIHKAVKGDTAASLAKKYDAQEDRIVAYNHLPKDGNLKVGEEIIVPDGKIKASAVISKNLVLGTPRIPLYGTTSTAALIKAASVFSHLPNIDDYFKAPTYGMDWGLIHGRNGVDIANSCGTPIVAAADGKIAVSDASGYNGGFGKYIKIQHGNGTETLYGHASKLLVSVGQVVAKGDKIALMGTTGRSTGCHLHFEVHGAHNPLAKD